jgi:hypothetical protein
VREIERERDSDHFVVACIDFIYMKIFVCFIKQACLLACLQHIRASYVVYANAHSRINRLYQYSLQENICLSYKTSLPACNHFQFVGGEGLMIAFYG